tara:strand:+ start:72 stop:824 length:753 start_codon:yes stop_codon:yes gene_type:complete
MNVNRLNKNSNILVSFKSLQEISLNILNFIDIIDLKDPKKGSLGAWNISQINKAVKIFGKKKFLSATIGDIKEKKKIIENLLIFDRIGLDFIKFGVFVNNEKKMLELLGEISEKNLKTQLVPVIFVDDHNLLEITKNNLRKIKELKYNFILLDTFLKKKGNLMQECSFNFLSNFIKKSSDLDIAIGLAGKLETKQISQLLKLRAKVIGFRSAVCEKNDRCSKISENKIKNIYSIFDRLLIEQHNKQAYVE